MKRKHFEWTDEDIDIMDKMVDDHEQRITKLENIEKQLKILMGLLKGDE